ncbi:MAG: hypothetical protein SFU53_15815 [Terrimicrobiaceae bacterium]|nr:hypothetical protein [Terrimicrobiaceae bacterium]
MQISAKQIDDFKVERKDITPPLPVVLRLVPLLFYCSIGVAIVLSAIYFLQYRLAIAKRDGHRTSATQLAAKIQETRTERGALEAQIKKASDIEAWVGSSQPIQPLLVEIARSMGPRSAIVDLRVERDPEAPSQLKLAMRIGTDSTKQLDTTLEKISDLDYRTFSPQQNLGRGELDYRATLVRQNLRTPEATPSP